MAEAKQELQLQQQRSSSNTPPRPCPRPSKNKEHPSSKPSRLQKRAPPTIQVTSPMSMALRCAEEGWKVAIPLLSPLILSPASPSDEDEDEDLTVGESLSTSNEDRQIEVNPVFMTWQHPAAPFYYDSPAPSVTPPFVHQCR